MSTIKIDLLDDAKIRLLLLKINKLQKANNLPEFTLEQFISMLLATPEFLTMIDTMVIAFDKMDSTNN